MASYLRPRRGKEATAKSQNIVLKRGEIFFETPSGGVGTGIGKIKMGDGSTSYASLPYFLRQLDLNDNNTKCAFTNATAATDKSNNTTYLNNIAPSNNLKTLFQNIKQLLLNYNSQLTSLNNDLANKQPKGNYQAAGSYAAANHNHSFSSLSNKPTTLSGYGITDAAAKSHNHDSKYIAVGSFKDIERTNLKVAKTSNDWFEFQFPKISGKTRIICNVSFHGTMSSFMNWVATDTQDNGWIRITVSNSASSDFSGNIRAICLYL